MPTNLIKEYNTLLELLHLSEAANIGSIRRVFDRDFIERAPVTFRETLVVPCPKDGEDSMGRLFNHLTRKEVDPKIKKREFDTERSVRIHWIKHHLEEREAHLVVFIEDNRVYILDKEERYVVILEPKRNGSEYYLITAYHLEPSRFRKMMIKLEKRGEPL